VLEQAKLLCKDWAEGTQLNIAYYIVRLTGIVESTMGKLSKNQLKREIMKANFEQAKQSTPTLAMDGNENA
jgi:hypothetical protein